GGEGRRVRIRRFGGVGPHALALLVGPAPHLIRREVSARAGIAPPRRGVAHSAGAGRDDLLRKIERRISPATAEARGRAAATSAFATARRLLRLAAFRLLLAAILFLLVLLRLPLAPDLLLFGGELLDLARLDLRR